MNTAQDQQESLEQLVPAQRHEAPADAAVDAVASDEMAALVRERDEARAFAQDLWVASRLEVKFAMADLLGGLPDWLRR